MGRFGPWKAVPKTSCTRASAELAGAFPVVGEAVA